MPPAKAQTTNTTGKRTVSILTGVTYLTAWKWNVSIPGGVKYPTAGKRNVSISGGVTYPTTGKRNVLIPGRGNVCNYCGRGNVSTHNSGEG